MEDVSNIEKVEEKVEERTEDLVPKKVVEEYKKDLFKFKDKYRSTEEELKKLREQIALQEKASLEEKEEWKTLYEREKEAREKALSELEQKSQIFIDSSKKNAVVQRLGGFKKESYARFINTSNIEVNEDGTFNDDSLAAEVDRIKQEFPELLKMSTSTKMPNTAPQSTNGVTNIKLTELSPEQLIELYSKTKSK